MVTTPKTPNYIPKMAKKQTTVTVKSLLCGHCEDERVAISGFDGECESFYCGIDCARASQRIIILPIIQKTIGYLDISLRNCKTNKTILLKKQYNTLWAARATFQAILDRDVRAYKIYAERAKHLYCECLEDSKNDLEAKKIADCMKDFYESTRKFAPAFIDVPYDLVDAP